MGVCEKVNACFVDLKKVNDRISGDKIPRDRGCCYSMALMTSY